MPNPGSSQHMSLPDNETMIPKITGETNTMPTDTPPVKPAEPIAAAPTVNPLIAHLETQRKAALAFAGKPGFNPYFWIKDNVDANLILIQQGKADKDKVLAVKFTEANAKI